MKSSSVIIVEDNEIIRNGLCTIIDSQSDLNVVGCYESAETVFEQIETIAADVFLLDIHLSGKLTGLDVLKELRNRQKNALFIILTIFEDTDHVFEALKLGAVGYLLKSIPPEQLLYSIRDALNGGAPMSSSVARKVVDYFSTNPSHSIKKSDNAIVELTQREQEIIELLANGYRYKEIAEKLFISKETVRTHIRNMYEKLHVKSNIEAVNKYFGVRDKM